MAELSKTVEIIFGAKDNLTVTVKNLESSLKDFDATVTKVAAPLADVASKVLAMETAVLALTAAFVGKAIESAGKFGDSVREIGTLFGATSDQVGQFGADIQAYAANSTQSIESINGAIYEAISSGVKYEDALKLVNAAEQLSVAGRADLTQVTDVLTGTLNAYGASSSEAANYTDDLLTAVNLGKTTVPELASSLANVTSIAAAAGVPFSDLSAAVAGVTAAGKPTAEAMTAIRGVLEAFVSPSEAAKKAAEDLGISLNTSTLKSLGLEGALKQIYEATGGTVEGLSNIFTTTEGLQGALILGADKSGIFAKALKEMETNSGATARAYETMAASFENATQRLVNAAEIAMIKAGQPLLDEFGGVAEGIAAAFQALGSSIDSGAFAPILTALETFGASAAATLQNIARNLPEALAGLDFSPLLEALDNLGVSVSGAFEDIFGNINLDTPEGLASALQTIVNGIAALTNVTSGIIDSFEPIFTAFGDLAREAGTAGEESQVAAGQFLGVAQQIMQFGTALTAALTLFSETGTSIVSVIDIFAGGVKLAFNAVQTGIDTVGAVILGILKTIASGFALVLPGDIGERWAEKAAQFDGLLLDIKDRTETNTADMAAAWGQVERGLEGVGKKAEGSAGSMDTVGESSGKAAAQGQKFTGLNWDQSATGIDYVGEAAKRLGLSLDDSGAAAGQFGQYMKTAADETDAARAQTNGYRLEIDELGNRTYTPVIEGAKKTGEEVKKSAQAMEEAAKKAVDYDLKLQEIASAERIAYIEAKLKLDEAQINADTQKVVAAFESINTAITSTGDTLSSLVSAWAQLAGTFEGAKLWDLIQAEEKRRQAAFEQQKLLLDEQIKYLQARTALMLKGDAMIKIEASPLSPHLERIFQEILRVCQIKANEQGLGLLLGALS